MSTIQDNPRTKFCYADLPPELQNTICEYALQLPTNFNWRTEYPYYEQIMVQSEKVWPAPELLAALRPHSQLYSEALVIFYKINSFALCSNISPQFRSLKKPVLRLIQRLTIHFNLRPYNFNDAIQLFQMPNSKLFRAMRAIREGELVLVYPNRRIDMALKLMHQKWDKLETIVVRTEFVFEETILEMYKDDTPKHLNSYNYGQEWVVVEEKYDPKGRTYVRTFKRKAAYTLVVSEE